MYVSMHAFTYSCTWVQDTHDFSWKMTNTVRAEFPLVRSWFLRFVNWSELSLSLWVWVWVWAWVWVCAWFFLQWVTPSGPSFQGLFARRLDHRFVCMYVCVRVCMYIIDHHVCMYVCTVCMYSSSARPQVSVHVCMCAYMHANVCIIMYVCVRICMHMYVLSCMYVCVYVCLCMYYHVCMCAYMYASARPQACVHVCMSVCVYASSSCIYAHIYVHHHVYMLM
jgi:hypothetical protein